MTSGTRLGPYEVLGVIGAGAMGEVYRARDTNLQRDVAIKVLPAAMAAHPRRLARFEREARTLAALNHPNIATVYAVESGAIVMELVEGDDLSERIRQGAIPLPDALPIARQVADAVAAAHDAGIVHRDLKPANIKVRRDGTVKVLDFGLAKDRATEADWAGATESGTGRGAGTGSGSGSGSDAAHQTVTLGPEVTGEGEVLGTAAYMAPEQARGKPVDKRADIWAFGVILFEMVAGRRPFLAADTADALQQVVTADPDWSVLPHATPASIRRLLARCLARDPRRRLHDIADARLDIDEALDARVPDSRVTAERARSRWGWWVTGVSGALLSGLAIGALSSRTPATPSATAYVQLGLAPARELNAGGKHPSVVLPVGGARTALAWSPHGRILAFIGIEGGGRRIYVRDLAAESARAIPGTEGARALVFSPDGSEVAFWDGDAIRRVKLAGGPPVRICGATTVNGITWGATRVVFSQAPALLEVSPAGGEPRVLTDPPQLVRHALPVLLPGDTALLYTEYQKQWTSGDERVMVLPLSPGATPRLLLERAADARYLPTGHLAFLRQGTLFVVPFDAAALRVTGEPVAVVPDVSQATVAWDSDDLTLAGQFAISPEGTLAYVTSAPTAYPDRELVAVDRQGRVTPLGAPAKGYRNHVDLSPDGTRLAVSIQTAGDVRLFTYDLQRGTLSRIGGSLRGEVVLASWAVDDRIAVQLVHDGRIEAAILGRDAAALPVIVPGSTDFWASSLGPSGRLLGMKGGHVWLFAAGPATEPARPLTDGTTTDLQPSWSPDGRWYAYASDATGRFDVYLRPFPGPGDAVMVSLNGGSSPAWDPGGRELFYIEAGADEDRMMAVPVTRAGSAGRPQVLFTFPRGSLFLGTTVLTPFAVAPGGQRFYAVRQPHLRSAAVAQVQVVLDWFDVLRTKLGSSATTR